MDRNPVTTAVHEEIDRPTFSDRDVVREQEMGDRGADGGRRRSLRLWLTELDSSVLQCLVLVLVFVVCSSDCRQSEGES
jgi:hypothetical protein